MADASGPEPPQKGKGWVSGFDHYSGGVVVVLHVHGWKAVLREGWLAGLMGAVIAEWLPGGGGRQPVAPARAPWGLGKPEATPQYALQELLHISVLRK